MGQLKTGVFVSSQPVSKVRKHVLIPVERSKQLAPPRTDVYVSLRPGSHYRYHLSMDGYVYTVSLYNRGSRDAPVILPLNRIKDTAPGPVGWVPANPLTKEPSGMRVRGALRTIPPRTYSKVASAVRHAYAPHPLDLTEEGRGVEKKPGPSWHLFNPDIGQGIKPPSTLENFYNNPKLIFSIFKSDCRSKQVSSVLRQSSVDALAPDIGPHLSRGFLGSIYDNVFNPSNRIGQVSSVLRNSSVDGLTPDVGPYVPRGVLGKVYDGVTAPVVAVSHYLFGKPLTKIQQAAADIRATTFSSIERRARLIAGDTSESEALVAFRLRIVAGVAVCCALSGCLYLWYNGTFTRVSSIYEHTRDKRGLSDGAEELASGLGNGIHDGRTLNHALFSLVKPLDTAPVSLDPVMLWFRAMCGGSGYYTTLHVPLMNFTVDGVRFVRRGDVVTAIGVSAPFQFQRVSGLRSSPLASRPTVSFCGFARHLTIQRMSTLTGFGSVVEVCTYAPGPLHFCSAACPNYTRDFTRELPDIRSFGNVYMCELGDDTYLSWGDTSEPVALPSTVLYDTVSRWMLAGKVTQYATISIGLRDYPSCIPLVMAAVGAGYRVDGGFRDDLGSTEVLIANESTLELDPLQSNVLVHNPILPNSLVNLGRGIDALSDAVMARVRANTNLTPISQADLTLVADFANYLVGGVRLVPYDINVVYEHMCKPSNVAEQNNMSTTYDLVENESGIFAKTEPVKPDGKSTRIIVTFRGNENYALGRYVIPLSEHLSRLPFWAPGKVPSEIQDFIHLQHCLAKSFGRHMEEGDYSAFDSTTGAIGYALENAVLSLAYGIGGEWSEYLNYVHNVEAKSRVGSEGMNVAMGNGTMSGCKNTTMRNTMLCAFVAYANARDSGMNHHSAIERVESCIFSGDDSSIITCDYPMSTTAGRFGLKLESRLYDSGPTTFLGRFYPDPYSNRSCVADVPRFLRRIHLLDVPPNRDQHIALAQRALGNLVNDPDTPLLSTYCRSVLKARFITTLDPLYHDKWKYDFLISGNTYSNSDFSYEELFAAIASYMGVDPLALEDLDKAFRVLPGVVGTKYPALGHHVISYKVGRVINGVPFGGPGQRPDIRMPKRVSAAMAKLHEQTLSDLKEILVSSDIPTAASSPPEDYTPLCEVCQSQYHKSDMCPLCSLCQERGHTASSCVRAEEESFNDDLLMEPVQVPKTRPDKPRRGNKGRNRKPRN